MGRTGPAANSSGKLAIGLITPGGWNDSLNSFSPRHQLAADGKGLEGMALGLALGEANDTNGRKLSLKPEFCGQERSH